MSFSYIERKLVLDMEVTKEFKETFEFLSSRYGGQEIFSNLMKMCAISIYNVFAKNKEMEQDYLKTINTYKKEHQNLFPKLFSLLIEMYEKEANAEKITDILGDFYTLNNLTNSNLGQVFTPAHISHLMAKISIGKEQDIKQIIKEKGFITMCEPTCGTGGMILSFAKALKDENINYQQNLLVEATDISEICAYMTYIQLALYGIPAIVYCGNTLTKEIRFKMETPLFFLQYWKFRRFYINDKNIVARKNMVQENTPQIVIDKPIRNQNLFKEATISGNNQISLW